MKIGEKMRNVLIFDSKNAYKLSGMSAIDDGTQTILIGFITETPIEVSLSSGQTLTYISGLIDILPEDLNISVGGQTIVLLAPPTSEGSLTVEQVGEYVYQERFYEAPTPVYDLPIATGSRLGGVIIGDGINVTDQGVISAQNIEVDDEMSQTSENPVQNKVITLVTDGLREGLDSCFRSVSEGKSKIASAITDKGVPTEPDATFDTMEQNIRAIPSGGDTLFGVDIPIEYGYLEYDSIDIELETVSYTPDQYLVIPAVELDS